MKLASKLDRKEWEAIRQIGGAILVGALLVWAALSLGCGEASDPELKGFEADERVRQGRAYFEQGDYAKARQEFAQALALNGSDQEAANALSWVDRMMEEKGLLAPSDTGRESAAMPFAEPGDNGEADPDEGGGMEGRTPPEFWQAYMEVAEALRDGDYAGALAAAEDALSWLSPDSEMYDAASKVRLAALVLNRNYQDGSEAVTDLLALHPDDPALLGLATLTYQRAGWMEDATWAAERAYQLDEANPESQNNLAYTYAVAGNNLDAAYQLASRALAGNPDNAAYLDTMAWVLYRSGDLAGAYDFIQRASAQPPGILEDGEIEEHYQIIVNDVMNARM
jgi:tetratricopeptide (TPR) repeat protein